MVTQDKRQARGRFGWVRRLVQGQSKPEHGHRRTSIREHNAQRQRCGIESPMPRLAESSLDFMDHDSMSAHSDNVSTVPLKLLMSIASTTASPSVLSGANSQDNLSFVASTTETSLAPSTHLSIAPSAYGYFRGERERDNELIITLASSSHRVRRRSIDTNCSLAGIPPASILERLLVHPIPRSVDDIEA